MVLRIKLLNKCLNFFLISSRATKSIQCNTLLEYNYFQPIQNEQSQAIEQKWKQNKNVSHRFSYQVRLSPSFPSCVSSSRSLSRLTLFPLFHLELLLLSMWAIRHEQLVWSLSERSAWGQLTYGRRHRWVCPGSLNAVSTPAGSNTGLTSLPCKLHCWCHNRAGYTPAPACGIRRGNG